MARNLLLALVFIAMSAALVTALSAATPSPTMPNVPRIPAAPQAAPPPLPHTLVPVIEGGFATVEADLTTRELVFTRKVTKGGVHAIIEYRDTDSHMRQSGLWFYRDPVRRPLPRGLSTIAIRRDNGLLLAIIYPMEDDVIVKRID